MTKPKNKPLVLLLRGDYKHSYLPYIRGVESVGLEGRFVMASVFDEEMKREFDKADGILICGGSDIDPALYSPGEPVHSKSGKVTLKNDLFEKNAILYAEEKGMPILGICRGVQMLNAAFGGTLYQDVDDQMPPMGKAKGHQQKDRNIPRSRAVHDVNVEEGSRLYEIVGQKKIRVNSTHHQGVKKLAPGLVITGRAPDGMVEALEKPGENFIVGVQYHPERIRHYSHSKKLFRAFEQAVRKYSKSKQITEAKND